MRVEDVLKAKEVYLSFLKDFIEETEDWIYYWIANEEVKDAIKEGCEFSAVPKDGTWIEIHADYPEVFPITRCIQNLRTFRKEVAEKATQWKGKIVEAEIEEMRANLEWHTREAKRIEEDIKNLEKGL